MSIDYWKECISQTAEEIGLTLTAEQLHELADSVMGGHENYGMAFYSPPAGDHYRSEIRELEAKLKHEKSLVHCRECDGRGSITTNFGFRSSTSRCYKCNGEGKHK